MEQPTSKVCTVCGTDKPLTDFHKRKAGRYGRHAYCRECRNAENKAWRDSHPESVRATKKRTGHRWSGHKEWARQPENVARRRARVKARAAELVQRSDSEILADWDRIHPNGLKRCAGCGTSLPRDSFHSSRSKPDGSNHRCKNCRRKNRVRRKRVATDLETFWSANRMSAYECTYCGVELDYLGSNPDATPMHVDHIIPVYAGGTDEPINLAPACKFCNSSKGHRSLADWLTAA